MYKYLIIILGFTSILNAQDLTGKWVAVTSYNSGYYAGLYLVQNSENVYAGHCYDTEEGGYCRHWLDAKFNPKTNEFIGLDMELISKSPSHAPTDYILKYEKDTDGKEYLTGTSAIIPYGMRPHMIGLQSKKDLFSLRFLAMQGANHVRYIKVEENYKIYNDEMPLAMTPEQILLEKSAYPEVFEDDLLLNNTPAIPKAPEIPSQPTSQIIPEETQEPNQESSQIEEIEENDIEVDNSTNSDANSSSNNDEPTIIEKRHARTDRLLSHVNVKTQTVTLLIRDYGTVDNDSVTIFYNDKIIAKNLRIESTATEFELKILPHQRNELVFVANNLGDVPPNTAKITLISDKKRYNYKLFTDEENNALIILENVASQ